MQPLLLFPFLAQNLQDDLRHKDVRKALHHWTGEKRLSQDEADELMEDNYRSAEVFVFALVLTDAHIAATHCRFFLVYRLCFVIKRMDATRGVKV